MSKIFSLTATIAAAAYLCYSFVPALYLRAENRMKKAADFRLKKSKNLYLTFDDGPDKRYTPALLDLLKENDVHATFFSVADFAAENPDIMERIKSEGHLVGVHSTKHKCAMFMGPVATRKDIEGSVDIMHDLGEDVVYFRPPWGLANAVTAKVAKKKGLKMVMWDVMVGDWAEDITPIRICERLRRRVRSGSIICLHDGRGKNEAPLKTIAALKVMLPEWKKEGYNFLRMDEK